MITEFKLSEKEIEAARQFEERHRHPNINKGAIGGFITYKITPTSIGNATSIKCDICKKEENITDYDNW
jgi:hypothetical protein